MTFKDRLKLVSWKHSPTSNPSSAALKRGDSQPARGDAGAQPRRSVVSAQHTKTNTHGGRRTFPACDPGQSGGTSGGDCQRGDGPGRTSRGAQGGHEPQLRG